MVKITCSQILIMFVKIAIVLVALATSAYARISTGQCPTDVTGVENFDNSRFLGDWYEYAKYEDSSSKTDCGHYTFTDEGLSAITVQLAERVVASGAIQQSSGTYRNYAQDPAKINLALRRLPLTFPVSAYFVGDAYVTYIDYDNFAVMYHCANGSDNTKDEMLWILSREASPSAGATSLLSGYLEMTDFIGTLSFTNQDSCPSEVSGK